MNRDTPVMEELCTELGRFLMAVNSLENELFELYASVARVAREDAISACNGATMGPLLGLLLNTYRGQIIDPMLLASLDRLEPLLNSALNRSNEFVHASWWHNGDVSRFQRHRRPRRKQGDRTPLEEFQHMQPDQVFSATDEVWRVTNKLVVLRDDTLTHLGLPGWWSAVEGQS